MKGLFCFAYLDKMGNLIDLTLGLLVIGLNFLIADFVKTESVSGSNLILLSTYSALSQLYFKAGSLLCCHNAAPP